MTQLDSELLENELREAHLLCVRREFGTAKSLLLDLRRRYPGNVEVEYLLARLDSTDRASKDEVEQSRAVRTAFNLQTTWRRIGWGLTALGVLVFGAWNAIEGMREGFVTGFNATITTLVYQGRRYGPGGYVPWTRPVYVDVLYGFAFLGIGLFMLFILWRASKGIAQWEELDAADDNYGPWVGGW